MGEDPWPMRLYVGITDLETTEVSRKLGIWASVTAFPKLYSLEPSFPVRWQLVFFE